MKHSNRTVTHTYLNASDSAINIINAQQNKIGYEIEIYR